MKAPAPLNTGDTIAILSPAGALRNAAIVDATALLLEKWGLKVKIMPHAQTKKGYYSGTAEERMDDFAKALTDNDIKAVLCSYGGYGCVHLLRDFATLIKEHPKWIIGMSDCSALHAACLSQGIMSIHASQCNHLSKFPDSFPANMLRDILFGKKPRYENTSHKLDIHGTATGKLAGGNLSVLTALIGTEYDIFKEDIILFIEDVGEQPYRIERMMYQLELCGALSRIKGVIVGQFTGIKENPEFEEPYKIIHNIVKKYNIPVCFDFPIGHCDENIPLIEGAECMLTVAEDEITLEVFEEIK